MTPFEFIEKNMTDVTFFIKEGLYEKSEFTCGGSRYAVEHWFAKTRLAWQLFSYDDCSAPWMGERSCLQSLERLKELQCGEVV